jgi:hypothetical protein
LGGKRVAYGGVRVKILQVVPRDDNDPRLKALLKRKERELRGSSTTFVREREGRWVHKRHPGWINWEEAKGGLLVAEVRTKREGAEWQLLQAFIGYLDRHLGKKIGSISIIYR